MNKQSEIDLSIVIPAYGGERELERCLQAIGREQGERRTPAKMEVIVADDATPGGLSASLKAQHAQVLFVTGKRNLGFAGNSNRGVAASRGRVLCLLNTDMYVKPGYFEGCLEPFAADSQLFAVCGQINEPTGNNDGYKQLTLEGSAVSLRMVQTKHRLSEKKAAVPYANGGGSFFSRRIFDELNGFDPIFTPYYWEDTDLGYRAWKRGYHIVYDPKHSLVHDHQGTIGKQKKRRIKRIFRRNRRFFIWRNNTSQTLFSLVFECSLKPALKALIRVRIGKCLELLGDLSSLPAIMSARRLAFRQDVRSDAEVLKLWDQSPIEETTEVKEALSNEEVGQ
jgi:O-antigen biosynthesis protein